jgi:hypothetical protein
MNYYETLLKLSSTERAQRQPGFSSAATVIELIKDLTAAWHITPQAIKITGYQFQTSLWRMTALGLLAILFGFAFPVASLIGAILLCVLLLREFSHPLLGKLHTVPAENLLINLPAKNKEAQKVFLVASYDTEPFLKTPFALKPGLYLTVILGILAVMVILSVLYLLKLGIFCNYLNLFLLILIVILNRSVKSPAFRPTTLKNCAALLETAAILIKVKPDITSVALCFCGSRSLNAGILAFEPEFAKGPEDLTYVVNLIESDDANGAKATTLQCLASEGALPGKSASPILLDVLEEVARAKSLTLTTAKTCDYTETYPLNRAKIQPVSIVIPQGETVPLRDVRELLCGLIRKLDH